MARFHGKVGFTETVEISPGIWEEVATERMLTGKVDQDSRGLEDRSDSVNPNITVGNVINVVSDAYSENHIFALKYVEWAGTLWYVTNVDVQRPRLLLRLGGVYRGTTPV